MSCARTFSEKHADKWTKRKSKNGPRMKTKPGFHFVSFCPQCPVEMFGGRQMGAISVTWEQRTAKCRHGHKFDLIH